MEEPQIDASLESGRRLHVHRRATTAVIAGYINELSGRQDRHPSRDEMRDDESAESLRGESRL